MRVGPSKKIQNILMGGKYEGFEQKMRETFF